MQNVGINTKIKKFILVSAVVGSGIFFLVGSMPGHNIATIDPPKVDYIYTENLSLAKQEEVKKLKKEELEIKIAQRENASLTSRLIAQREQALEKAMKDKKRIDPYTSIESAKKHKIYVAACEKVQESNDEASNLTSKLSRVQSQLNKLAKESRVSCFPKDTQVMMSDGTYKYISELKQGDALTVYDIGKDTITESTVNKVFVDENNHYYVINDSIKATAYERFLTSHGWETIKTLQVGDKIFNGNSYVDVSSVEKIHIKDTVYNLNINENHNFFVSYDGKDALLVHNSGGGGGGGGGDGGGK
jgi:hypothetical protein